MLLLLAVVYIIHCVYAQDPSKCIFPDSFGNGVVLNLSALAGTKIVGGTSSYNTYQYSVCVNGYKCHGTSCMVNQINKDDGKCACLQSWDDGTTIPAYFDSQQTWEYQYFSDNYFTRIWWICNSTADPYSIRFTGAEADGMFGIYVDSKYACVQQTNSKTKTEPETVSAPGCNNNAGCSYNGVCTDSKCVCHPQWKGDHCASLNFLPTPKTNGLQTVMDGGRVSSWGGSVLRDDNGTYWMYAVEMGWNCGINVWLSNSIVVMARSTKIDSNGIPVEFTRYHGDSDDAIIGELFSHEPSATRALDTGEYVIYFSNIDPPPTDAYPCNGDDGSCTNGMSLDCDIQIPRNWDSPIPTKMIYSKSPYGPWSDYIDIPTQDPSIDSNLATYIFPNGSMVGIARGDGFFVYHATNWKDVSSYKLDPVKVPNNCCGEDPYIWYDSTYGEVLHIVWHAGGWDTPMGVHTWSTDGGYVWEHIPNVFAYENSVEFTDGSNFNYQRRERPHLIMDKDGITPLALTNAVENGGQDCDYSHTLVQPLNQK